MRKVSLLAGLLGLFYAVAGTASSPVPRNVENVKTAMTIPLYKANDAFGSYMIFFSIGTPGQIFNLTVDTILPDALVFNKYFTVYEPCVAASHRTMHLFDPSLSSSVKVFYDEFGAYLDVPYIDTDAHCAISESNNVECRMVSDVIRLCNSASDSSCVQPQLSLNISTVLFVDGQFNSQWKSDGVFGLALGISDDDANENHQESSITTILRNFVTPQMTIYLKRSPIAGLSADHNSDGTLTIGGTDTAHCDGNWLQQNIVLNSEQCSFGWCVSASSAALGTATMQLTWPAIIEMTMNLSSITTSMFNQIVVELGAQYDFNSDTWLVDCWSAEKAPDFTLNLTTGGVIGISSRDYIAPLPGRYGACQLMFTDEYRFWFAELGLGSVLFKSYCVRYDLNSQHLSFAKTII